MTELSFTQFVVLYGPNSIGVLVSGLALVLMGSILSARAQSFQAIVASQISTLGVVLSFALGLLLGVTPEELNPVWVMSLSAVFCVASFWFWSLRGARGEGRTQEVLLLVFLAAMAASFVLTSALPSLDSHFSKAFLGDVATASRAESWWIVGLSTAAVVVFGFRWSRAIWLSFWFGKLPRRPHQRELAFEFLIMAIVIAELTRVFGFLYTASCLVVLPTLVSSSLKSLKGYLPMTFALSLAASFIGISASWVFPQTSTTALLVLSQLVAGGVIRVASSARSG